MRSDVRIVLAVGLSWIAGAVGLVLFAAIRRYRIDIKPTQDAYQGASRLPPVNYLSPRNYTPAGQRLLRWFWAWYLLMLIVAIVDWLLVTAS